MASRQRRLGAVMGAILCWAISSSLLLHWNILSQEQEHQQHDHGPNSLLIRKSSGHVTTPRRIDKKSNSHRRPANNTTGTSSKIDQAQAMDAIRQHVAERIRTQNRKGLHPITERYVNETSHQEVLERLHQHIALSKQDRLILKAYLEPIHRQDWKILPLPVRNVTRQDLEVMEYSRAQCPHVYEGWPVDDYPGDRDPFLPWVHDVFVSRNGTVVQFVAQNKRRCKVSPKPVNVSKDIQEFLKHYEPQVSLFQHVPLKRHDNNEYRLSTHEEADADGIATRFLCRFKVVRQEDGNDVATDVETTLSVFNNDYEWAGYRKKVRMFSPDGHNQRAIHTSQLLFQCSIPKSLQSAFVTNDGDDDATTPVFYVDLVPIRTPPRYGPANSFLVPYYQKGAPPPTKPFDPVRAWGSHHFLPSIEGSGRWENIPVCSNRSEKIHYRLTACLFVSRMYKTRGDLYTIADGPQRLLEWLTFHLDIVGVEHVYLYDNSLAHGTESLQAMVQQYFDSNQVTYISWPHASCSNRLELQGERSAQYAAESSCLLRYGPFTDWLLQLDIDEYLIPPEPDSGILPLLEQLDKNETKILSLPSIRWLPRMEFLEPPIPVQGLDHCRHKKQRCFDPKPKSSGGHLFLEIYNCDPRQAVNRSWEYDPAEKQIYRPDYVRQHFVHYSTMTQSSILNTPDFVQRYGPNASTTALQDPHTLVNEHLLLHAKTVAAWETAGWERGCASAFPYYNTCRLGMSPQQDMQGQWIQTCRVNGWIQDKLVPLLEQAMANRRRKVGKADK